MLLMISVESGELTIVQSRLRSLTSGTIKREIRSLRVEILSPMAKCTLINELNSSRGDHGSVDGNNQSEYF